jgi:integrase
MESDRQIKGTKNNEHRQVEVPFPDLLQELTELAKKKPHGVNPESFIFWSDRKADQPMKGELFLEGLRDALQKAGFSEKAAVGYVFHSWRHFFTVHMRPRIDEKLLQKQTGHKTLLMLDHYSDHVLDGDRERMRRAQRETFGALIPEAVHV